MICDHDLRKKDGNIIVRLVFSFSIKIFKTDYMTTRLYVSATSTKKNF